MNFEFRQGRMCVEGVDLERIAEQCGTPVYVYSAGLIRERYREYEDAWQGMPHRVCYAVKANSNLAVLALLAREGAGFDIVSGGELFRVLRAGGLASNTVFSGVGKSASDMAYALDAGVHSFNCESLAEIDELNRVAREQGKVAKVSLRVNPDVDPATHPYISTGMRENKFGIDIEVIEEAYDRAAASPGLQVCGVSCHIGSQMLDIAPMVEAVEKLVALAQRLRAKGLPIGHLDLGGGLGVRYLPSESTPSIGTCIAALRGALAASGFEAVVEPGRSIVAEAGVLLTRILYKKNNGGKEFVIVDAAMNDLIRPSLYKAFHDIVPLRESAAATQTVDIVGPVCESGDWLAKDRAISFNGGEELLAIKAAGAYGFGMASNYNSRGRVAEVLVEGDTFRVVRDRESWDDLVRGERL